MFIDEIVRTLASLKTNSLIIMKARISLSFLLCFMLLSIPSLPAYSQGSGGYVKKEKCTVCGKLKQNCPYKGNHPKPIPSNPTPTTGTLSITSTPSDVSIKLDGEYIGTTPLTLKNRKPGSYKVTFSAEGYETTTKSVTVSAGKTAMCNATLNKKQVLQPVEQQETTYSSPPPVDKPNDDRIFVEVEENAQFPGGDEACMMWLKGIVRYPEICIKKNIQGRVQVGFVVNRDGSVVDVKILSSPDPNLSKEAERVVKMMPKWKPARQDGKFVRSRFNLPINFRLTDD